MKCASARAPTPSRRRWSICNLLIAGVLASLEVWRPSVWGTGPDEASWVYAANRALWTWVGFFLPLQVGRIAWE